MVIDKKMLKKMRLSLGWSKSELSRTAGISSVQIRKIEDGEVKNPHDSTLSKLHDIMAAAIERRNATLTPNAAPTSQYKGSGLEKFNTAERAKEFLVGSGEKGITAVMAWLNSLTLEQKHLMIQIIKSLDK